jgi:hypothetical protein
MWNRSSQDCHPLSMGSTSATLDRGRYIKFLA